MFATTTEGVPPEVSTVTASSYVISSNILCVPSPAVKSVVAVEPTTNLASVTVAPLSVVSKPPIATNTSVSYTHLTLPTTPYV